MSPGALVADQLERLSRVSGQQVALRALVGAAGGAFPLLVLIAGGGPAPIRTVVLVGFVGGAVLLPDSSFPLAFLGVGVLVWVSSVPFTLGAVLLLATLDLLVVHLACTLAAYGPPELVLPRSLLRVWGARAALLAAWAVLGWVGSRALRVLDLQATGPVFVVGLVMVTLWAGYLLLRLTGRDGSLRPAARR